MLAERALWSRPLCPSKRQNDVCFCVNFLIVLVGSSGARNESESESCCGPVSKTRQELGPSRIFQGSGQTRQDR